MEGDLISVVVPVKDRAHLVVDSVQSILSQTYGALEIIVIENNSRDPDAVRSAVKKIKDDRVKFFSLSDCPNANVARNFGVARSNGEYVAFLDSDDTYEINHLENALKLIKSVRAHFLYGASRVWDGEVFYKKKSRQVLKTEHRLDYFFGPDRAFAATPTFLVHRSVFSSVSWDERLFRHQDYDFFIACTSKFKSICNPVPSVLVQWRRGEKRTYHSESMRIFYKKWFQDARPVHRRNYAVSKAKLAWEQRDPINAIFFFVVYLKYFVTQVFLSQ